MNCLFVHQNFPGQYRYLAAAMVARGDHVMAIGGPTSQALEGVELHRYNAMPAAGVPPCHGWVADLQTKALRAEAVAAQIESLKAKGLGVDLVIGHPGWGELLVIKDVLPGVPVLHQVEFIYQLEGADVGFDQEISQTTWQSQARLRLRRAPQLLALEDLDWGLAPTEWQASTAPSFYRKRISVIHEGIDTEQVSPRQGAEIRLQSAGLTLRPGDEVVSFVARNLEPYRGIHSFLRMLPLLQKLRPQARVVIVGGEGVSYGAPPPVGTSWKQLLLQELGGRIDHSRVHFVGRVPHAVLHELFRVCTCHVYLTYPFVLSWSLLEAMACGAVVIGSATAPVQEVIVSGRNGLLVDFFDGQAMAETIASVLAHPESLGSISSAARQTILDRYDLATVCLPQQLALVDALAAGRHPHGAMA
ncbi:glycosyltransferase [Synechococcus sp. ATX 2A4]|uniref:glycosyltransferase n=1 Tax=Synechococcus sp. ATX 2A4 TaxID=2823727 RepID=UPI0020CD2EA2|nr:glycosyltransferase [Synechococcus sp. ATX 2A4]MCP9884112.1 glycosyltransferase [Synechococcus sp. ATX 2A4]